ncbi:hypothetical protein [Roseomonas sp. CECT 9278]|uniref:hypothetical protein n=1 Tax=Roseomonas sp. CECT 9278 TaxID=2845823 RepID=UPI001E50892F|nr:hypothetical protein [Roseomonas sp. CECT 9278]CAH0291892.1 hypothetical protein ROS9278_04256 [Roseomonas sp. CECT 9278]
MTRSCAAFGALLGLVILTGCDQAAGVVGGAAGQAASGAVAGAVGGPAGQVAGAAAGAAASAAATPAAQQLASLTAAAGQNAWDTVANATIAACTGAADKDCAEAQALRARACRRQAATAPADQRGRYRDCAVTAGQAALAAGGANTQVQRNGWREELLAALYDRRAVTPRASICPDNDLMRAEADTLLRDAPGNASARFHGGSARLMGVAVSCAADDQRCPDLAQAARLLTPPSSDPRWVQTLEGVRTQQRVVVGCPDA